MHNDNRDKPEYHCRVCGLLQKAPIWGDDGNDPSWAICDCCGSEFGYHDCLPDAVRKNRELWVSRGAKWFDPSKKPDNWDLETQMANIPNEFR